MDLYTILGYIGAFLTGFVLALLGGGGALFSIPVLVYFFHIPASVATGYSLFLVGITATYGAIQNIRKQLIDYNAILHYGVPSTITVYCMRRFVMPALPNVLLTIGGFTLDKNHFILFLLVLVMFIAGYKMITAKETTEQTDKGSGIESLKLSLYAIVVGSFLGIVGAGGGFLMIPALVLFAHIPMRKAIGTSLVLVAANSFIGFLGDIHSNAHQMNVVFLLLFSGFSIAGVIAGNYMHRFVKSNQMKKYFGWFIVLVAVLMLVKELSR